MGGYRSHILPVWGEQGTESAGFGLPVVGTSSAEMMLPAAVIVEQTDTRVRQQAIDAPFRIELEQESDGRWVADIDALPGVMAYGNTRAEAERNARALALRVLAERIENLEPLPDHLDGLFRTR